MPLCAPATELLQSLRLRQNAKKAVPGCVYSESDSVTSERRARIVYPIAADIGILRESQLCSAVRHLVGVSLAFDGTMRDGMVPTPAARRLKV